MKKQVIRLTESDLHRIIKESVDKLTDLSCLEDNEQQLYQIKDSINEIIDNIDFIGNDSKELLEIYKWAEYIYETIDRIIEINSNAVQVEKNNGNEYKEVRGVYHYSDFILVANNIGYNFLNTETNELLLPQPLSMKKTEISGLRSASLKKFVPAWTINGRSYCVRENNEIYEFNPHSRKLEYTKVPNYRNY